MSGSTQADVYNQFIDKVPDTRFTFMNHGYYSDEASLDWLDKEDLDQKYSMNLIHFMLGKLDLKDKAILDVGCGRGGNCSYLARYTNAKKIVGLDFCAESIEFCKRTHQYDRVSFQQGDAQSLPFDDESFDFVINIESSHCYPDINRFYQEAGRVLKKSGTFCYADVIFSPALQNKYQLPNGFFEYAGLTFKKRDEKHEEMLQNCGFNITDSTDITDKVIKSLECEKGNFQNFLKDMADQNREGNVEFIDSMFDVVNGAVLDAYKSRETIYMFWRLEK